MSADLAAISEETVDKIRKAQTQGVTSATGLVGIDLSDVVSLVPCNTPLYDRTPRKTPPMGADVAQWKAQLNVNSSQPSPFVGLDAGGQLINIAEQDMMAKFLPVRVSGQVTQDAIARSRNYDDAKARATASAMIQWRLADNKAMWGGQNFPLPGIGAITLTAGSAGTSVASGTAVRVQARSGLNYFWGGSGVASAAATTGSAAATFTASVPAVRGAVAYDWFVAGFYYTTTVVNTVVISSVPTQAAAVPTTLPGLFGTAPALNTGADTSYSSASYNGLLATLAGDVSTQGLIVTPGTGTASGASFASLGGGTLTANGQGVKEIDDMFDLIWNAAQLSPDVIWMNATQARNIADKILSVNTAVTYLDPHGGRQGVTAGGSVARYLNKSAGGVPVEIHVDPHLPPGRLVFVTEQVPYPDSGIVNATEVRTLRDVAQTPYGASLVAGTVGGGPREVFDVSSIETFLHRAPVACGVITDINAG